jgi:hypothetical protein
MSAQIRFVLGIAVTVGVIAALWLLAVAPEREQAADLGAQVALAEQTRDAALNRAATAEAARGRYGRDYATVARLGKAVPVSADVPSLVFQLESAARRAKVDFRAVTVLDRQAASPAPATGAAAASGGVQPAPFSFKFEGDFFGLQRLLKRIDQFARVKGTQVSVNGRLLTIDGVTMNPGRSGLPRIQGLITARAYVADLPAALPAAGAGAAPAADGTPTATTASQVTP